MSQFPPPADGPYTAVRATRSSEQVADALRRGIADGSLSAGEILPPERTLAERFKVTRNTVREALRQLEHTRLLSIRQGSGITVLDYLDHAGVEFAATLAKAVTGTTPDLLLEIAEARRVLGEAMILHSVARFDDTWLDPLKAAIASFAVAADQIPLDTRKLQDLDFEIHSLLVRGGGNRAFVLLHNSIRHIYERVAHLFEPMLDDAPKLAGHYRAAVEALDGDDREEAARHLSAYFDVTSRALSKRPTKRARAKKSKKRRVKSR